MIQRAWFLLCALWSTYLIGLNLAHADANTQWPLILSLSAAPWLVPVVLRFALAWIVYGSADGKPPKVRLYRR